MELGKKIRDLRLKANLTQEALAAELGVTAQTISKYENDVCAPDISMLPRLSVYFGVTIDELFDRMQAAHALMSIAAIYEITGQYASAIETWEHRKRDFCDEWHLTECGWLDEVNRNIARPRDKL